MEDCAIYFGGVPPGRGSEYVTFDFGNFLGSMRSLTMSNPGSNSILNPLYALPHSYNPYFGIEPNCERKVRILFVHLYIAWVCSAGYACV